MPNLLRPTTRTQQLASARRPPLPLVLPAMKGGLGGCAETTTLVIPSAECRRRHRRVASVAGRGELAASASQPTDGRPCEVCRVAGAGASAASPCRTSRRRRTETVVSPFLPPLGVDARGDARAHLHGAVVVARSATGGTAADHAARAAQHRLRFPRPAQVRPCRSAPSAHTQLLPSACEPRRSRRRRLRHRTRQTVQRALLARLVSHVTA